MRLANFGKHLLSSKNIEKYCENLQISWILTNIVNIDKPFCRKLICDSHSSDSFAERWLNSYTVIKIISNLINTNSIYCCFYHQKCEVLYNCCYHKPHVLLFFFAQDHALRSKVSVNHFSLFSFRLKLSFLFSVVPQRLNPISTFQSGHLKIVNISISNGQHGGGRVSSSKKRSL